MLQRLGGEEKRDPWANRLNSYFFASASSPSYTPERRTSQGSRQDLNLSCHPGASSSFTVAVLSPLSDDGKNV